MDAANIMAGQKRGRSDDDEEFDWELDLEWRKVGLHLAPLCYKETRY
jgi:hypothetical protein